MVAFVSSSELVEAIGCIVPNGSLTALQDGERVLPIDMRQLYSTVRFGRWMNEARYGQWDCLDADS